MCTELGLFVQRVSSDKKILVQIMDGFETARMVRQKGCISRNVPIVALTAATAEGEVEKCITSGMDDYISKPVTRGILQRAIDKWVGKESRWV